MTHRITAFIHLLVKLAAIGLLLVCTLAWSEATAAAGQAPSTTASQAPKSVASSLGIYVYPRSNQGQAQQQKDENECYGWARQQTGIDPTAPPESTSKQQSQVPKGGAAKGAAAGALGGTAIGAITGDTGQGAAVGATAGAIRGRRAQKKAEKQAEQQAKANAEAAQKNKMETFRNAFSACMDARQYSVK
jgi:hypothetical protein